MRLPISILMGSILAIIFATSSLMSLVLLSLTNPIGGASSNALLVSTTAYAVAIIGVLVATATGYLVMKGSERARMVYLVWTAAALVLSMSVTEDPLSVLVEATLAVIVLFFWFLPSSSEYLVRLPDERYSTV